MTNSITNQNNTDYFLHYCWRGSTEVKDLINAIEQEGFSIIGESFGFAKDPDFLFKLKNDIASTNHIIIFPDGHFKIPHLRPPQNTPPVKVAV